VNRLRTRLIVIFLAATLAPLAATVWLTSRLLEHSLSLAPTRELDDMAQSLQATGRALFQSACEGLKAQVSAGQIEGVRLPASAPAIRGFADSGEPERCQLAGEHSDRVEHLVLRGDVVFVYSKPVPGPGMRALADRLANTRAVLDRAQARDLRRGLLSTLVLLAAAVWVVSLVALIWLASRISKPIEELTRGLTELAKGNLDARLTPKGNEEIATAMRAFNYTAEQLQESRDKLIHVTRLSSWQTLARKMAHEVKNSLTPIRLTVEEMLARKGERDDRFMDQAAQIVVDEVTTLERRVRAFSDFAAEPPLRLNTVNLNALIEERIALLKAAHPEVIYNTRLTTEPAAAVADEDLVKGVLTNLLENAAHAAGGGGVVLGKTFVANGKVGVEIHDSGPGLSLHARTTLFEPTISFKKAGMGLGLSIAKKSALMLGGDIVLVEGELGGAAFRVMLPRSSAVNAE
jgi:nitrogen fixation/metabolism regulation signal transduction histidine kinase